MSTTTIAALPVTPPGSGIAYRLYRGLDEIPGMAAANGRLRAHVGLLEPIDVDAMTHRYTHLVNSDPLVDCVVVTLDGTTVGYGRAEWQDLTDGDRHYGMAVVVEPAAWGRGIGGALLDWCEARLRVIARDHRDGRRAWFATSVFDGDADLDDTVQTRGYEAVRWDAEMLRDSLDDLPGIGALPPGYEIRPVPQERLHDVGAMLVEAFREHWGETEQGDESIRDWVEDPRFDIDLVTVVWHGDDPATCVSAQVQERSDGTIGYVDNVATHPGHRRLGLARAALVDSLHRLAGRGLTRAYLGVDTDNHNRAFALYEDAGFRKFSGSASYRKPFDGQETGA